MNNKPVEMYAVPAKFRGMENLHILFWLVKDICWCIAFKPLGIAMIFPTFSMAIYIMWQNRQHISELTHNLAIALWILANSMWMIFEFLNIDDEYRLYCLIPFSAGLSVLLYYYLYYMPFVKKKALAA
ncbi:MAG: hypothetical protein ABI687_01100, partial [Flavitalea sp.]